MKRILLYACLTFVTFADDYPNSLDKRQKVTKSDLSGTINYLGDADYIKLTGKEIIVTTDMWRGLVFTLYDDKGAIEQEAMIYPTEHILYTLTPGIHYVKLEGFEDVGAYSIQIN